MKSLNRWLVMIIGVFIASALTVGVGTAISAADFPNRPITIVVPVTAGGGYDLGARNIARFLPKHLPKKVDVVVDNMPGGGQLIGVHSVYAAKQDGYTLVAFNAIGALMAQFVRPETVKFDMNKFIFLGLWQQDIRGIGLGNNMKEKTWDALVKRSAQKPILIGTGGAGTGQHIDPLILEAVSDLKLKYIHYDGNAQVDPAIGRGEVEMQMGQVSVLTRMEKQKIGWGFCVIDVNRAPLAPNIPTCLEAGMPRAVYDKMTELPFFGVDRVLAAPPGTDPEIVEILRDALWKTFKDPEYLDGVKKIKGEDNPMTGKDYQNLVGKKIQAAKESKDLIEKLKF
ncbi:MAG: tripartite tricarboxylate transporter substrate-binding protein [Thermodesulfobacteriota bacterium]